MNVQRGDVVLVDYPYSDRTGSKLRPCLVVQNDGDNQRLDDTIIALITTRTRYAGLPTEVLIDLATPEGQQSGLLYTSVVQATNLLTIDQQFVRRRLGDLPVPLMQQVDQALKAALELP
jgi:mRNA interferase MazF